MTAWHLITGEYPPQPGGVADYTAALAAGLADAGDAVHVWCPLEERGQRTDVRSQGDVTSPKCERGIYSIPRALPGADTFRPSGAEEFIAPTGRNAPAPGNARGKEAPRSRFGLVHRSLGRMAPADWRGLGRALDRFPRPRRLLVQWVPHAFGWRSLNLPFCLWLAGRGRRDRVEVMVHEPFVPFAGSWRQRAAAGVHRAMTVLLLRAARAVWLSCGGWEAVLRPYALGRRLPFRWLPVPSNVPVRRDPDAVSALRARVAPDRLLLGHFGTYGGLVTELLRPALVTLLRRRADLGVLLLGRGGGRFRDDLARELPDLAGRLHAAPDLPPAVLSHHLQACDLLLQPYPDGVSGRRTSLMAGLAHGKPVVTTEGPLTEKLWGESGAVRLVPAGKPDELAATTDRLLDDPAGRARLAAAGADLYRDRFDLAQTLAALRGGEVRCGSP